jgi:ligand-binding SRPBCC domain-containing protein
VFHFFRDPSNLARITPAELGFKILTPPPLVMREGAVIDYTIHLLGLPVRWTTIITTYDPPHRFEDVQLKGPYAYWHHTHSFRAVEGGTEMTDTVRYLLPGGPVGPVVNALFVKRRLENIFMHRALVIAAMFPAKDVAVRNAASSPRRAVKKSARPAGSPKDNAR